MKITLDHNITKNFTKAIQLEWLETNGLGGWASSTIFGANTRRYHGLLIAATQPPVGRMVLLSKLDESIEVKGQRFELGCNQFPGAIHPQGYLYLQKFEKNLFPIFHYKAGDVEIRKTVAAINGENTVVVLYEILRAPSIVRLLLQPFVAYRDYHSLSRANPYLQQQAQFKSGILKLQPYPNTPTLFINAPKATFRSQPDWYYRFEYKMERYRGLDYQEDLFTHGLLHLSCREGDKIGMTISTDDPRGRDALKLFNGEKRRRLALIKKSRVQNDLTKTLVLAADQFLVRRGQNLKTIIAGYHWFTDWGRDTMIALPGLTLVTGRGMDAKKILRAFAQSIDQGMLPNRFPEGGIKPEYNTVDATLWFFIAVYKYLQHTNDQVFVRKELMPVLRQIIEWHDKGTRYNIHVDDDGLLYAGAPGVQLTWMDAKVGDWVVTPRQGRTVEVNALWYNVLKIYAELLLTFGEVGQAKKFATRANKVKNIFVETFWDDHLGYLYDVVDGQHKDPSLRPNQIFALSLPFPLLSVDKSRKVLQIIESKLLTPFGLRSLVADHPNYKPHYGGNQYERDQAYHQGTVWSWLLGPYITALVRFRGANGIKRAQEVVNKMTAHLSAAGLGTISEIFDAEPPHRPRGCIAQAWSVAEILRALIEDVKS